jgi:hypothetical protein
VYGQICLLLTMLGKALHHQHHHHHQQQHEKHGSPHFLPFDASALRDGWTRYTWVPILTQALGGVIVGLVTKHAGGVKKGFALIAGIALTAFVQAVVQVRDGHGEGGR